MNSLSIFKCPPYPVLRVHHDSLAVVCSSFLVYLVVPIKKFIMRQKISALIRIFLRGCPFRGIKEFLKIAQTKTNTQKNTTLSFSSMQTAGVDNKAAYLLLWQQRIRQLAKCNPVQVNGEISRDESKIPEKTNNRESYSHRLGSSTSVTSSFRPHLNLTYSFKYDRECEIVQNTYYQRKPTSSLQRRISRNMLE